MNKAVLLQLQEAKAKASQELEVGSNMRQVYENLSYEDNEIKQDPDLNSANSSRPSKMIENQQQERIDCF